MVLLPLPSRKRLMYMACLIFNFSSLVLSVLTIIISSYLLDRRCVKPCLGKNNMNLRPNPVCGTDHFEYFNQCRLEVFICTARYKGRKLALKHPGKCTPWEIRNPKQLPLLFQDAMYGLQQQLQQQLRLTPRGRYSHSQLFEGSRWPML